MPIFKQEYSWFTISCVNQVPSNFSSFYVSFFLFFSPSDLDADLEDNQDYDSTVSQSETNLTTIGQSPQPTVTGHAKYSLRSSPKLSRSVPTTVHHHSHGRGYSHSTTHGHGHRVDDSISRPLSHPSRFREHGQSFQGAVHQAASAGLQSRTPGRGHTDGRCLGLASFRERAASNSGGSSTESNCLTRKGSQESMESRLLAKNVELEKVGKPSTHKFNTYVVYHLLVNTICYIEANYRNY